VSRCCRSLDWIAAEIVVTSVLCGYLLRSWWVGIGLLVVFAGLNARADGRWSLATLSAFCWIGLGTMAWTRYAGLDGGLWVGLALGGAVLFAHRLLPSPPPMPKPETRAEVHKAQVERAVRDVLVIAMILLGLFGFFRVGAAEHVAPAVTPSEPAPAPLRAPVVPPLKGEL
jgi:hypothetical protein